jgi:hypothetical protein
MNYRISYLVNRISWIPASAGMTALITLYAIDEQRITNNERLLYRSLGGGESGNRDAER